MESDAVIMYSPGGFVRLKRFGDTHASRECVFPPGKISSQIDVILRGIGPLRQEIIGFSPVCPHPTGFRPQAYSLVRHLRSLPEQLKGGTVNCDS